MLCYPIWLLVFKSYEAFKCFLTHYIYEIGLGSILFALTIESVDLNSSKDLSLESLPRSEPIIAVPPATIPKKISRNHHVTQYYKGLH